LPPLWINGLFVYYLLGYSYCNALWKKEKDFTEFRETLLEIERNRADNNKKQPHKG
jgi:hypothetical protein